MALAILEYNYLIISKWNPNLLICNTVYYMYTDINDETKQKQKFITVEW